MRYLLFFLSIGLLVSCSSPQKKAAEEISANLEKVNASFSNNQLDTTSARKAEQAIGAFLQKYPQDSMASEYLFDLGMLYQKQRKFEEALNAFDKCYREYPDSKMAPNAVFLQGFLYANVLNNLDKAKEKYQLYLDQYSDVDPKVTSDVKMELDNLGKSADELLKEIQEKSKADSTVAQG